MIRIMTLNLIFYNKTNNVLIYNCYYFTIYNSNIPIMNWHIFGLLFFNYKIEYAYMNLKSSIFIEVKDFRFFSTLHSEEKLPRKYKTIF